MLVFHAFIFPHPRGVVLHLYSRMINMALLPHNTKQHIRPLILQCTPAICSRGSPVSVLACIPMFTLGLALFARWQIERGVAKGRLSCRHWCSLLLYQRGTLGSYSRCDCNISDGLARRSAFRLSSDKEVDCGKCSG